MKKVYIIVLNNQYLLFSEEKVKKKGNYLQGVKLFETGANISAQDICKWVSGKYTHPEIAEVKDWE